MKHRIRLEPRMFAAGILASVAALIVLVVTRPPATEDVLVAAEVLPAGVPLGELEVAERSVRDPSGIVLAESLEDLKEAVLLSSLGAGSPIPRSLVVAPGAGDEVDLIGLDLEAAQGVHGRLQPGDSVDMYSTSEQTTLVASDVVVVDVSVDDDRLGSGSVHLLLAVDQLLASVIIEATTNGELYLVRRGR